MRAGILVVGNELLQGHVHDANGPFLARELTARGHDVRRIVVVPDELGQIRDALTQLRDREGCQLLVACGGLGPTLDDVTTEAVAAFLGLAVETPPDALDQIRRIYRRGHELGYLPSDAVDEAAWRMARVPSGAVVIPNDEGAAPGWVSVKGDLTVVVMPGPPAELQSVWANLVSLGRVAAESGPAEREISLATFEAPIASVLEDLCREHPGVALGSYPKHGQKRVTIRLRGPEAAVAQAEAWLRKRLNHLVESGKE